LTPDLSAPSPIEADHDLSAFDCGKAPLNDWLRQRALRNEGRASRCFVVCEGRTVVGYYTLSAGSVRNATAPGALRRNMPPEIPILLLGRLAVDQRHQRRGIGPALLRDALKRALAAAESIGAGAILVHAIDHDVVPFYAQYGFKAFPESDLTLFLPMSEVAAALR